MVHPSLNELLSKVDNKYILAVLGAKRAREIVDGSKPLVDCKSSKPVTIALEEIAQEETTFQQKKNGI
ncbi:MAG: DNA-directed RNA polymerase subunit omega [Veillonellales bacterium]